MAVFPQELTSLTRNTYLEEVWFRLFHVQGVGNRALWEVGVQCGDVLLSGNFEQDWPILSKTTLINNRAAVHAAYVDESLLLQWKALQHKGIVLLHPQNKLLQEALQHLQRPDTYRSERPAVLYYWGAVPPVFKEPTVGIIGARDADPYVLDQTMTLAKQLAAQGCVIFSGYARGVDTYAHVGALCAGGRTAAVLPHGITDIFSPTGGDLPVLKSRLTMHLDGVDQHGLFFLSQFYPRSRWKPQYYILRNQTICAFSKKLIVMTATAHKHSGSYQTGIAAHKLGIPLYVFMPNCPSKQSVGNRHLCEQYGAIPLSEDNLFTALSP